MSIFSKKTKLNLGSGELYMRGYINIDNRAEDDGSMRVDQEADVFELEWKPDSVDEVMVQHLAMYIGPDQMPELLKRWASWLKPGGKLVLETTDIRVICANLAKGDLEKQLKNLYGWGLSAGHKWGWCPETLYPLMRDVGLSIVSVEPGVSHNNPTRDFRITAKKT